MSEDIKVHTLASDMEVKEVTGLDRIEGYQMNDTDTLLLIRQNEDGSQTCYSVKGRDFHGEDAYEIAVERYDYKGTREEWDAAIAKIINVQPLADKLIQATEEAKNATANCISVTEAVKLLMEEINKAEAERVNNELDRQTAETKRDEAENLRYDNEVARKKQEEDRVSTENARVEAENNRKSAETTRSTQEDTRQTQETNRQTNENTRTTQENSRVEAETSRATAETSRSEAENNRATAESTRVSNETQRETNESTRNSSEEVRITNESNRDKAEQSRVDAEKARVVAEEKRETDFNTAKTNAEKATDNANSMASNPPYVDKDGYYYKWNVGTQSYDKTDVNLTGKAFLIKKVFTSVAEMTATDISTFNENDFILINTANTEDEDNAKLYVVSLDSEGNKFYSYLVDMSGFRGFTGHTPQMLAGTVTSLQEDEEPAVSVTSDDVDSEGNPKYKINFGIPKGKSLKYSDLTEEQLAELKKPATDAATESKAQTALCEAATSSANEASQASSSQTELCKAATDKAQTIIDKFGDLVAAINIEVTGSGNVLTDVTQTDSKLTFTKNYSFEGDTDSNITELDSKVKGLKVLTVSGSNYGDGYGTVLQFCNSYALKNNYEPGTTNAWYAQIMADTTDKLRFRTRTNGGSWTAWKELINTSSWAYVKCLEVGDNRYLNEGNYGLHMNNSDITGCNRIMFNDRSDGATESISFPRSDGKYDSIWAQDGYLKFTTGMSLTGGGTNYTIASTDWINGNFLPLSGGVIKGYINFNSRGNCFITYGDRDYGAGSTDIANLKISSWYGISFTTSCEGFSYTNKTAVGIDCRNGDLFVGRNINAKGDIVAYASSDSRLKDHIHIEDYISLIESLGGIYTFNYKKDGKEGIGLIAQNLLNTKFNDIVTKGDNGYYKVNYWSPKLISLALGGISQTNDRINELESKIKDLQDELRTIKGE